MSLPMKHVCNKKIVQVVIDKRNALTLFQICKYLALKIHKQK